MVIAIVPLVALFVGALVYAFTNQPKAAELGRIVFACGVLAWLLACAGVAVRIG